MGGGGLAFCIVASFACRHAIERGLRHFVQVERERQFGRIGCRNLVAPPAAHEAGTAIDHTLRGADRQAQARGTADWLTAGKTILWAAVGVCGASGQDDQISGQYALGAKVSAYVFESTCGRVCISWTTESARAARRAGESGFPGNGEVALQD